MSRPYVVVPTRQFQPRLGFSVWCPSKRVNTEFLTDTLEMRKWLIRYVAREGWTYYAPVKCSWRCGFAFTDENLAFEFKMRWG